MKRYFLLVIFVLLSVIVKAQDSQAWEKYFYQLAEFEDIESSSLQSVYDILCDLDDNPININTATREDLMLIPFLNEKDIEDISAYIYQYGPLKTMGELSMIESIGHNKRMLLGYFVYIGDPEKESFPSVGKMLGNAHHEIMATGKIPTYSRKGDKEGYLGYKYKHNVRYDMTYGDYFRLGVVGAQDSGEPFFAHKNSAGYDHYSFYLQLKKLGRIKNLVVGRYRVNFGMGLVINNDFTFGKVAMLTSLGKQSYNIRPHSSRSSSNYLQGAAVTVQLSKGLDISGFVSYRKIDATLNKDSSISTILDNGYHRTETEMSKKNNTSQWLAGTNIRYKFKNFHVGATAIYTSLNRSLSPKTETLYRRYYATGDNFYNISLNYGYRNSRISFNGETATGDCGALATINTLSFRASDRLDLLAVQRFYSYKYYSLFSQSFSEGGYVQNESGIYLGANWRPLRNLSVMAYTDYAYFAWPKYQISDASHSFDNMLTLAYTPGNWAFTARYRLRIKDRDNEEKTSLIRRVEQRGRVSAAYNADSWSLKTQADISKCKYKDDSFGWMISQYAALRLSDKLRFGAVFGYFNTDSYDSRLYIYEQGMMYDFSFPAFYGEGIRYSLLVRGNITPRLMITAKAGTTNYFDRDKISSSYQQINHSSMTDIEVQLKYKF